MSRRISIPVVLIVALLAFAVGTVFGHRTPRFFSKTPPTAAPPLSSAVVDRLPLANMLVACKPSTAVMLVQPRRELGDYDHRDDDSNLPFQFDVAEWLGPTDVLEVRKNFLTELRKHYDPKGLVCYGPGIDPNREGDPNLAQEIIRIDTVEGDCWGVTSLSIHITGNRCKVKACVMPASRWVMPK